MKYLKFIFFIFLIILQTSCSIKGKFYGLYGYYSDAVKANPSLFIKTNGDIQNCDFSDTIYKGKVIVTNGECLKKCLNYNLNTVVYIWSPKCSSKICYPLEIIQNQCSLKKVNLFIVAEYYEPKLMAENYNLNNPLFGIDTEYYNSSLTKQYLSHFLYDLTGIKTIEKKYLFFQNGIFQGEYTSIDEIIF
jgi:hypothetical protein